MKKLFITGGGGYVGSRLVEDLCDIYDVTIFDTFYFESDHLKYLKNKIKMIKEF